MLEKIKRIFVVLFGKTPTTCEQAQNVAENISQVEQVQMTLDLDPPECALCKESKVK